jgi:hypothetical protein
MSSNHRGKMSSSGNDDDSSSADPDSDDFQRQQIADDDHSSQPQPQLLNGASLIFPDTHPVERNCQHKKPPLRDIGAKTAAMNVLECIQVLLVL